MNSKPPDKPRRFKTPEDLLQSFLDYKAHAAATPWKKEDFIRTGLMAGQKVHLETECPLTEWGFAAFCKLSYQGLRNYGEREGYESYFDTYAQIKTEMAAQRISGGIANAFNANLVARIDGIREHSDVNHTVGISGILAKARERAGL